MNQTKTASRIVGLIDVSNFTTCPLAAVEPLVTREKTQTDTITPGASCPQSYEVEAETVYYKAHLPQMMRQLERELHSFRRLFSRATSLQRASSS